MKIRRALAVAATAAVIAPTAVLAVPAAAFATEAVSEAGPRTPAPPDLPGATSGGKGPGDSDGAGQSCAFESDQLHVAVNGLPHQLAAGGAWNPFSMTLTNTTGKLLAEVQPFLVVSSAEDVDPKTLKPRESVHVQLRFRVGKDLPLDHDYDAYTGLTGTFVDRYHDRACTVQGQAVGTFSPRQG
ncbi:hypothetical protein [Streptomyces sp. WZ-12]|uniref:hypothetical protein n=1 Tax=Streptomyces sp. WZ-12 TaxID=3030210 RepID=UPI00238138A1|nr:hypothetical protein [Streptomyces sp. WZ-12]